MRPEYFIENILHQRVVRIRMAGIFDDNAMVRWANEYRERATTPYKGLRHMVIADMRGMRTVQASVAQLMGAEIGHARRNGVVLCAHISDNTVQRLQAARVARLNSPDDDVTIDVDSPEEAERVVHAYATFVDDPKYRGSIREAIASTTDLSGK